MDADEEAARRLRGLESAIDEVAALSCEEMDFDSAEQLVSGLELCMRRSAAIAYSLIGRMQVLGVPAGEARLRDRLANLLRISGADAGARIATAADLSMLAHTGAAAGAGLIGAEAVRIIRDTIAKLPATATAAADREYVDVELAAVAVAERPEVLRREAAKLLAAFDAEHSDPGERERARAARRGFTLGPQDADGMSRGTFCLDPEARAYLDALLAKAARPGMCNPADPMPGVDGDPDPGAAACDLRTTAQRNHDAVKTGWRMSLASGDWGTHRGLPVTAVITMTLQQLEAAAGVAVTGGKSTVPVEVALRMAAHAHHYLYIYDENSGREIWLGRSKRIASADQRVVLYAIDGGCSVPGCDQPAYHCQVHHLIEWASGGTTDLDRLTLVCEQNHQLVGQRDDEWIARRRYDERTLGQTLWYPPRSVDPERRPRTNRYHKRPKPPRGEAA